ncbi:MAG: DMT family transporter [Rhodospirillales bacterium]|jgi:drug/metabolite transporter (DMT)-like permease
MRLAFPSPMPRAGLVGLLLVLGAIWGGTFSLARTGGQAGIGPFGYGFWFLFGVGSGCLAMALVQGVRVTLSRDVVRFAVIGGLFSGALPSMIMFTAVRHIPTGVMAVIITLAPVVTYATALAVRHERFVALRAVGMMAGLAGAALIVVPRSSLPDPAMIWWVLFAFITPFSHGTSNVYAARARPQGLDSWMNGALFQLVAAAVVLPFALATGQFHIPFTAPPAGEMALWAHVFGGVVSQFLMFELLRLAGPVFLSQVAYLVTLAGIFWGWLLFAERLSPWVWLAAAVIAGGVLLVTRGDRRAASR